MDYGGDAIIARLMLVMTSIDARYGDDGSRPSWREFRAGGYLALTSDFYLEERAGWT